jgi:hypothetical protein
MSFRAFAKLVRVNESTVRKALTSGRLELSIGYRSGRPYIRDVELALAEWEDTK